jgi:hypothetical protein
VLGGHEVELLFAIIRRPKERGVAIITSSAPRRFEIADMHCPEGRRLIIPADRQVSHDRLIA